MLHIPDSNSFATLEKNIDDIGVEYTNFEKVKLKALDSLIDKMGISKVDFVFVDVEGTELDVLKNFNCSKWRPRFILVEDKLHYFSKHSFLKKNSYKLVKRTCMNNWYIPQGTRFDLTTFQEKIKLLRKVYLGLPFRKFNRWKS